MSEPNDATETPDGHYCEGMSILRRELSEEREKLGVAEKARDSLSLSLAKAMREKYDTMLPALMWYAKNLKGRWSRASMDLDLLAQEARLALIAVGEWPIDSALLPKPEPKEK